TRRKIMMLITAQISALVIAIRLALTFSSVFRFVVMALCVLINGVLINDYRLPIIRKRHYRKQGWHFPWCMQANPHPRDLAHKRNSLSDRTNLQALGFHEFLR